jgi:hypothetical protein
LLLVFAVLVLAAGAAQAQEEEPAEKKGFDKSKLFFGGNFGMNFGDYTLINVSPQIGYRFNPWLAVGAGPNFIYSSILYRYWNGDKDYRANYGVAGLNVFGRVYPIEFILLQIQPELNYTWGKYKFYDGTPNLKLDSKFVPSLLAGAGGVIPAGRGSFIAMVQYDLLQNERSPYGKRAFYNFGYNIGF